MMLETIVVIAILVLLAAVFVHGGTRRLETRDAHDELPPPSLAVVDDRVEVGLDFAGGPDVQVCRCMCGFECDTVEAIVLHLRSHGARSVVVTPANRRPRR